jgi:hypothetical protein
MHRPQTALLVAVAVAAACLSSPPAPRAEVLSQGVMSSVGSDQGPSFRHQGAKPNGDSDQFTTKTNPTTPKDTNPIFGSGPGIGTGGTDPIVRQEGIRVRIEPTLSFDQLLRALFRTVIRVVEQ